LRELVPKSLRKRLENPVNSTFVKKA